MQAKPIGIDNAIDAFVFTLQLSTPITQTNEHGIDAEFTKDLPGKRTMQGFFVQMGGASVPAEPPALFTRFRAKDDGTDKWALQINGPTLSVVCRDYDHYSAVSANALEYLRRALKATNANAVVLEATLQIVDRFQHAVAPSENAAKAYQPTLVFSPTTRFLTPHVAESGLLWHVHQGWFDPKHSNRLYQLNLSNTQMPPDNHYETIIDFRSVARGLAFPVSKAVDEITGLFAEMHAFNKKLLEDLLSNDMQHAIGL